MCLLQGISGLEATSKGLNEGATALNFLKVDNDSSLCSQTSKALGDPKPQATTTLLLLELGIALFFVEPSLLCVSNFGEGLTLLITVCLLLSQSILKILSKLHGESMDFT